MKSRTAVLFGAMLLAACLTGCGGGGGSDGNAPPAKDMEKPAVISRSPAQSVGVATNSAITMVFSEAIDPATINPQTITLLKDGTTLPVTGTVTYIGTTAEFKPASPLAANASYTATVTTGVTDLAGNRLDPCCSWQFTTAGVPDITPPKVQSTYPAPASTGLAVNSAITVTFNKEIDPATINAQTITLLKDGTIAVAGTVTYVGTTALFKPAGNLSANAAYTATVTTGVKDLAGNALAANHSWQFTTGGVPDSNPPTVQSTSPPPGATGVAVDSAVTVTFSEAVIPFYYGLVDGSPVAVTFDATYSTVTMKPAEAMKAGATYGIGIKVHDMAGNPMPGTVMWQFSTSP